MISAQASVGAAATPPTTGTILMTAEVTRQGAAARPQPEASRHNVEIRIHFIAFAWQELAGDRAGAAGSRNPRILRLLPSGNRREVMGERKDVCLPSDRM